MSVLESLFEINKKGSTVKREGIAGLTTFLAMAYITVVNPGILSDAGMDFGAVFVATCLAAAIGSIAMGLLGNLPVALAPGMGQNAFFTYGIVLGMGHSWQAALGAVFLSGIIFIVMSILPIREWLINAIPKNLKLGISAGIGFFLAIIALKNAGLVVDNGATLVALGDVKSFGPVACVVGFIVIAVLSARKVMGAVVIGMLAVSIAGWLTGEAQFNGVISAPPSLAPVFLELDIASAFKYSMLSVILTLLLVDVFDTAGTLVGVTTRAGLLDKKGHIPKLSRTLLADSGATVTGAALGTSSTTSFVESAAGVEAGGRTGMTAVFTGGFFLLCLFFAPLAQSIPAYASASALLFVAVLMAASMASIDWKDVTESAPAFLAAIMMPLTFSITEGIGIGFISYALIKVANGRPKECPVAVYVVAAIFLARYAFLGAA